MDVIRSCIPRKVFAEVTWISGRTFLYFLVVYQTDERVSRRSSLLVLSLSALVKTSWIGLPYLFSCSKNSTSVVLSPEGAEMSI